MDENRPTDGNGAGDVLSEAPTAAPEVAGRTALPGQMRERLEYCAAAWGRGDLEALLATGQRTAGLRRRAAVGWSLAAAFCLLAVVGWWPRLVGRGADSLVPVGILESAPELAREQFLHREPHAGRWPWVSETGVASSVRGDVVWDTRGQEGYLWLEGLEPTVGSHHQYQLWIFDASRDDRYPVDGGVFDVEQGAGHVVVPFHASRHVTRPLAFAVTLEKTGGVVVSNREKIVALARATGS